ncbi:hypothetical protein HBH56_096510 [Parastagonospora nodorum]|uniref:Uncharacterized protein n=2 Tax=Phaeosphaeria nodorum (strain SN15 / ATCC MYA-4574 / FGSC 10173) TaxID=321614 RepID=A0A7U2ICB6_PHANO|nr:hypothetical protein SNOG_12444 [Parastagonospora nodorum SN15]KAH3913957.1 hypothetical protein HBH56_096510 [Parastagonospora nodorum]EAT80257.2 hypothetical protein SNOG_12444 [Parastagonospora nodorum SN15]KAH3930330.1 hypothetical protein HBH54_110830 [Parastagonospora nodorum]KAH4118347.1 hypothetical protein HBH47_140560 [Parastagonospora nodorum]KAH4136086.1 hypothetical protein HBH45_140260 [Parastagonospora nodorum]
MLPSRKRKHIGDWLEEEKNSTERTETQEATEDESSSRKREHIDDDVRGGSTKKIKTRAAEDEGVIFYLSEHFADVSVVEIADGYQRRKVDNYIRQAQAARPVLPERRFSDMSLCLASDKLELDAASVD